MSEINTSEDENEETWNLADAKGIIKEFLECELECLERVLGKDHPYEACDCTVGDLVKCFEVLNQNNVLG